MNLGAPLAVIDLKRGLRVLSPHGETRFNTRTPLIPFAQWDASAQFPNEQYSWPTWSPDGSSLAVFRLKDKNFEGALVVFKADGSEENQLSTLGERLPIYCQWSGDSKQLAVLSQLPTGLRLSVSRLASLGLEIPIAEGSPLFFTWSGDSLATFIGQANQSQPQMIDFPSDGKGALCHYPGLPANFCAPVSINGELFYAALSSTGGQIVRASTSLSEPIIIAEANGLIAMMKHPHTDELIFAVAPDGDGSTYTQLTVLNPVTHERTLLGDAHFLAFLPIPNGTGFLIVRVDTQRNALTWHRLDLDGSETFLIAMHTTRDSGFFLRFFEQYCQSHAIINPDSTHFVIAGSPYTQKTPTKTPHVYAVPLYSGPIVDLGEGIFATFGPASA